MRGDVREHLSHWLEEKHVTVSNQEAVCEIVARLVSMVKRAGRENV